MLTVNHQPALKLAATRTPNNIIAFEDKLQIGNEILLKLIKHAFDLRRKIRFVTYLINTVQFRIIDAIRRMRRRTNGEYRKELELDETRIPTGAVENDIETKQALEVLENEIANLPRTEQIVMACIHQGMTQAQIAEQCGVSTGRISQIYKSGLHKLRENLQ